MTSTVDLDPWGGETARSSNQAFQPHRYTSYERDNNGGDEAMMRRYQSNWTRFSQPDPYDGAYDLTDPQSFNRYAYVQNDPVNFIDPTGLMWAICLIEVGTEGRGGRVDCWGGTQWGGYEPRDPTIPPPSNPQNPAPTPTPVCSEQDFSFTDGSGNYTAGDLTAITQTAVGEASTAFFPTETEAIIGTMVNRQNINIAAYPQRGPFARGQNQIAVPGNLRGGILGEYDAHRFGSGTTKLDGAKVNGVLPANSYVCDQLKEAKDFAVRAGNILPAEMRSLYPYTSNRGIGARLPAGATGVARIGNTRFFVDAGVRWPF